MSKGHYYISLGTLIFCLCNCLKMQHLWMLFCELKNRMFLKSCCCISLVHPKSVLEVAWECYALRVLTGRFEVL